MWPLPFRSEFGATLAVEVVGTVAMGEAGLTLARVPAEVVLGVAPGVMAAVAAEVGTATGDDSIHSF